MTTLKPLYHPLDHTCEAIRILEIDLISPTIVCNLRTVALLDDPAFDALSYTWGDARQQESITVNGHLVSVTTNLACAIRSVYHQYRNTGTLSKPSAIWADAVCINQGDVQEKSYQIPLMRKIYRSASTVYVWLGSPSEKLRRSFEATETIRAAGSSCSALPELDQKSFLKEWPNTVDLNGLSVGISALLQDEYWTRVWTFQEIVLGRDVRFVAGVESMPLESLVIAGSFLRRYMEGADAYGTDPQKNAEMWFATRGVFQKLDVIFDIAEMKDMVEAMKMRPVDDDPASKLNFEDLGVLGFQMSRCCALATERRATEPKDYVYGFSALLDIQIVPDYSPKTSIASIYCDLMEETLASGGNMCLLLLDTAGIGHAWDPLPGLPSWAPNFASVASTAISVKYQSVIKSNWLSFVGLHDDDPPKLARETESLFCTAVIIDSIENIGPCIEGGSPHSPWIQWLYHKFTQLWTESSSTLGYLRAITAAIVKSTSTNQLFHPPTTMFGVVDGDYDTHNVLMLVFAFEQVWAEHTINGDRELLLRKMLLGDVNHYYGAAKMLSAYNTLVGSSAAYLKQLTRAWVELCSMVEGLRIAQTVASHFGLFPPRIENGDLIAMINTCTNPAVLRKEGSYYAFVGWCYVSEYDGRPIASLVNAGLGRTESVEIR